MVGGFQLLVTCIAFSISKPFRKPLYTNPWFTVCILILGIYMHILLLLPSSPDDP